MHDGGDYYVPSYNDTTREAGFGNGHSMKRPPTPPRPSWFGVSNAAPQPSSVHPSEEYAEKDTMDPVVLNEFVEVMKKDYPTYYLGWCFTKNTFINPEVQMLFELFSRGTDVGRRLPAARTPPKFQPK